MIQQVPSWSEARRKTTVMGVLDWIALFCLGASLLFWGVIYFSLIAPPLPQIAPQTFVALALTVMSALIIPLFWSILVPTTPAGQLLSIVARDCTTTVGHSAPPIVGQDVPLGDELLRDASLPPTPLTRRHTAPASPPFGSRLLYPSRGSAQHFGPSAAR